MQISTLLLLLPCLLSQVSSAPQSPTPDTASRLFKLIAHSLTPPYRYSKFRLETYHIGAGLELATLFAPGPNTKGIEMLLNETNLILPLSNSGPDASLNWHIDEPEPVNRVYQQEIEIAATIPTMSMYLDKDKYLRYGDTQAEGWYGTSDNSLIRLSALVIHVRDRTFIGERLINPRAVSRLQQQSALRSRGAALLQKEGLQHARWL